MAAAMRQAVRMEVRRMASGRMNHTFVTRCVPTHSAVSSEKAAIAWPGRQREVAPWEKEAAADPVPCCTTPPVAAVLACKDKKKEGGGASAGVRARRLTAMARPAVGYPLNTA